MCTIVALSRVRTDLPLVIAATRDEFYARPSLPPRLLAESPVRVAGGRDVSRGGTWMGLTETGFFVGLTNQRAMAPVAPGLRSRGEVVLEALRTGDRERVRAYLLGLPAAEFPAFNLLYGDAAGLAVAYARPEGVTVKDLEPGVWVLANDVLGSREFPKTKRAEALVRDSLALPWGELKGVLRKTLGDRDLGAADALPPSPPESPFPEELRRELQALCVRTPLYGTVSATIAAMGPGRVEAYEFAAGPPDVTAFDDCSALLAR
jgi:uncharacterized protein with NRDE domain